MCSSACGLGGGPEDRSCSSNTDFFHVGKSRVDQVQKLWCGGSKNDPDGKNVFHFIESRCLALPLVFFKM